VFPAEADAFRELFDVFERVFYEATSLPFRVFTEELGDLETRFPTLVRYRMAIVQDVLDEYLRDEQLKSVVTSPWSYLGLPSPDGRGCAQTRVAARPSRQPLEPRRVHRPVDDAADEPAGRLTADRGRLAHEVARLPVGAGRYSA
jgi:hypothetical protein